jgi:TolA-binding protein
MAALAVLWTESPVKAPVEAKPSEQPIALETTGKKPGASDIFEATPPPPQTSGDSEVTAWKSAEQTHSGAAYQAYLDKYPDGMFAALARSRLSDLEAAAWQSAEQLNSRRGYQRFLDEYPNSALVALANSRMKQLR